MGFSLENGPRATRGAVMIGAYRGECHATCAASPARRRLVCWAAALALASLGLVVRAAAAVEHVVQLRIVRRRIENGGGTLRFTVGDGIVLRWTTDEATTVHLHGYDLTLALEPGVERRMRFRADATGRFPIGAHGFGGDVANGPHREAVLLYLEVHPA